MRSRPLGERDRFPFFDEFGGSHGPAIAGNLADKNSPTSTRSTKSRSMGRVAGRRPAGWERARHSSAPQSPHTGPACRFIFCTDLDAVLFVATIIQ
jgi:hypothetical protein